jgi:AmiR/NasT family two-component response regulator
VALVGLGESSRHALDLIEQIVREASCPVIALLATGDGPFVDQAAKLGIFAYVIDAEARELQGALDITLSRFSSTTASRAHSVGERSSNARKAS